MGQQLTNELSREFINNCKKFLEKDIDWSATNYLFDFNENFAMSKEISESIFKKLCKVCGWNEKFVKMINKEFDDFYKEVQSKIKIGTIKDFSNDFKPVAFLYYVFFLTELVNFKYNKETSNEKFERSIKEMIEHLFNFTSNFYTLFSGDIQELEKYEDRAKQMSGNKLKPEKQKEYLEIIDEQKRLMKKHGSRSQGASMPSAVKAWGLKQDPKQYLSDSADQIANNISKLQNKDKLPKN